MQSIARIAHVLLPAQRTRGLFRISSILAVTVLVLPLAAHAQAGGSPFDTGFTSLQNLFTGTIAKVASLIAIVVGGYMFAHGEPGAKRSRFAYVSVSRPIAEMKLFADLC